MNWQDVDLAIGKLAAGISEKPDYIIGIVRGGLVPARILASKLGVKDMQCLTVKKRDGGRQVVTEILEDLAGKSVLLVEDMLESGSSLIVAKQFLESRGAVVRTLAIYIQPQSEITPDYYLSVKRRCSEVSVGVVCASPTSRRFGCINAHKKYCIVHRIALQCRHYD